MLHTNKDKDQRPTTLARYKAGYATYLFFALGNLHDRLLVPEPPFSFAPSQRTKKKKKKEPSRRSMND